MNKPKYSIFKNTKYALDGIIDLVKTESSFRLELIVFFILIPIIILVDKSMIEKIFLFSSIVLVLIVEALNGAVERVVDLVTQDYNELAKKAKDVGSSAVFLTICLAVFIWGVVFESDIFRF